MSIMVPPATGPADLPPRPEFGPWNPGLESTLPRAFLSLETLFRPDNVETSLDDAREMSDVSGLPLTQLVLFRAQRLVVHEVLIRVMADLSVPVGRTYGDLGVNFRAIVSTILDTGIASHANEIADLLVQIRSDAALVLQRELSEMFTPKVVGEPARGQPSLWQLILGSPEPARRQREHGTPEQWALHHLDAWYARCATPSDSLEMAVCVALRQVMTSIIRRRGFLIRDTALLHRLVCILVSNQYGSSRIGQLIEPWFREVVARESYRSLRAQTQPVVMNVKGASASGKSTIRPYQRALAGQVGLDESDFAVITPDVWRKFLLDYDSLGAARRYAGTLTGREVEIIDRKLDRHMAVKAAEGRISHLLIDRFRFDSFTVDPGAEDGSQLLTRFGHCVYMQFMITPPEATVERAWKRGEQFGRYKAVEDLLAHNVEAYTGMPRLFFTWALRSDKRVHFEFLDNSVPEGERPRTVAFGINGTMNILDLKFLFDIDRYRKIDISARSAQEVYAAAGSMAPSDNMSFLRDCIRRMTTICFADFGTGHVYAKLHQGRLTHLAADIAERAVENAELKATLGAIGVSGVSPPMPEPCEILRREEAQTLGRWGDAF
ncbi:hypothetical protein [Methylobacterium sp.]|uniref:hypothetical protein n=1 Tax=Methylobacterium sp. TaxID=409 RepID=UPI003B024FBE